MRNIYDIIAEQKIMVDMQLDSYELDYLYESFQYVSDDEYIQESLSEMGKKVIAFIKQLIVKIKDLINKILGYFKKSGNNEQELNNIIKAANEASSKGAANAAARGAATKAKYTAKNEDLESRIKDNLKKQGVDISDKKENQKNNDDNKNKEDNKNTPKHVKTIEELLHESKEVVRVHKYNGLQEKMQLAVTFINNVVKCLNECRSKGVDEPQIFVDLTIDRTFRGAGGLDANPKISLPERVRLALGEGTDDETGEYHVSVLANIIMEYIRGKDAAMQLLNQTRDKVEKELSALERRVTDGSDKELNMIRTAANMIAIMANVTCTGIVKAYNTFNAVAEKIAKDYANNK